LQELHGIKDEYVNADGKDKVAITERAEKIQRDFDGLNDLVNQKSARLQDQLGRQQQMEELRKKFANAVKEVFAHFDKNHTNTLNTSEFKSCLQSLGEDPTDDQMEALMQQLGDVVDNNGEKSRQIGFEKFLDHCIKITSDTTTEKEISTAFRELAGDKDYITEEDLRRSGMENDKVNYLLGEMPAKEGVEGGYDYLKWASSAFSR